MICALKEINIGHNEVKPNRKSVERLITFPSATFVVLYQSRAISFSVVELTN